MADVRERVWLACLMDVYGPLLTQHRQDVMRMYCDEDLSLGEIAEQLSITRQGVSDTIGKARTQLEEFEKRLGLAASDIRMRDLLKQCMKCLNENNPLEAKNILENILKER